MNNIVIVVGSGISISPPSCLPNLWEYNRKIVEKNKRACKRTMRRSNRYYR